MSDEPLTTVDYIWAAIITVALIVAAIWAVGFYDTQYEQPPDTLAPLEQP